MQARVVRQQDFVELELSGQLVMPELLDMIRKLGPHTREHGDTRVLFNLLHLEGEAPVAGQMQVGEQVVQYLSHLKQVASVVPTSRITRASETVARAKGVRMRVFDSKPAAIAWLRSDSSGSDPAAPENVLGLAQAAIWAAVRHLFPPHAQAIQLPTGTLAISWPMRGQAGSQLEMATPITVRLEPELAQLLRDADPEQRERMAARQEPQFREGLIGYDPFTDIPRARVVVLG